MQAGPIAMTAANQAGDGNESMSGDAFGGNADDETIAGGQDLTR